MKKCRLLCGLLAMGETIMSFLRPKCPGDTLKMSEIAAEHILRWLLFVAQNQQATPFLLASLCK
jgi:hypothetical protein